MKSNRALLLIALLTVVTLSAASWAQDTGSITGMVKDPSGAAVTGANVTVTSPDRAITRQTVTNSAGEYNASALPAGKYDIEVSAGGFKKFAAKGVVLDVAQKARVDIALQVGAINTEVVVEGAAVAQVETQSSELAGTVTGKEISQLELNGRNFTQLVTLVPGVSNQTGQDEGAEGLNGSVQYSMNGGRVEYNNWEVDGGDNMDNGSNATLNVFVSLDAISEFKVLTSNYGAQYGRNGSGTVEVETKSGTKAFHGDAYEFVRNNAFNAKNIVLYTTPDYKKNDWGYTVGGPVYIPKLYNRNRDKTFFFWSQEWRRDIVPGQSFNQLVPSVAERGGDFSDLCPNLNSGTASDFSDCPAVPGFINAAGYTPNLNVIPTFNANDPNVQALLGMISLPTTGVPGAEVFQSSPAQGTDWREELVRVDHNFNDKLSAMFRYVHDSWTTTNAVPLWTNGGTFPTIQTAMKEPAVSMVARL
ncbi:MAG TPA: carboxypeptidase regulatory-like domain-containing protein, partial [Candidatus Sulfotelmatobacter sp.]|nr:carboxypeptidase regulatory-like domain-containing protein [Candidatus Sulfotelmatobacter sp.]